MLNVHIVIKKECCTEINFLERHTKKCIQLTPYHKDTCKKTVCKTPDYIQNRFSSLYINNYMVVFSLKKDFEFCDMNSFIYFSIYLILYSVSSR